jgi:SAM-dependent methyltransferase
MDYRRGHSCRRWARCSDLNAVYSPGYANCHVILCQCPNESIFRTIRRSTTNVTAVSFRTRSPEPWRIGCRKGHGFIDIGAGTGRVSIALANCGLQLVAVDPAIPMLQTMRRKSGEALRVAAEGTRLSIRRNSADATIVARLLYLVPDWQALLREAAEVLRPGGILFHEWGNGDSSEAWVQIREKARSLFEGAGIAAPFHPGARSELEVDSALGDLGFLRREEIAAGSGPAITPADFLDKIQSGEFSYVWSVPKDVQDSCIPELRRWCGSRFNLHLPAPMPAKLHWVVHQKAY